MRGHGTDMWICAAMIVGALALALFSSSALALAPLIGCVLMMVVMMRLMGGMSGPGDR